MSEASAHRFTVATGEAGRRLDVFLAHALGTSRARARRLLASGSVRVDGRAVDEAAKGRPLAAGQRVEAPGAVRAADERPLPEPDTPLLVLAEGPGWLAVDKPAGAPVHPLAAGERGSLLGALVARHPEVVGVGEGGLRSGVVHRLDVDTSGVLLFATREPAWQRLREAFRRHRVAKTYRSLVHGRLPGEGELVLHLAVARHRPARVRVVDEADPAFARRTRRTRARWRSLETFGDATLVEVCPATGFLHQVRVSLAHLGHPVVGDVAYGAAAGVAPRHLLHASHLAWQEVEAAAPDPPDLKALLAELRAGRELGPCAS